MLLVIVAVAVAMEPLTALVHRYLMHEIVWVWHKSHHERFGAKFELNDLFPVVFSIFAIALFVVGINHPLIRYIAIGITVYGLLYFVVHEVVIHSRFGNIVSKNRLFEYWKFSHNVHHQYNEAPFGFIAPVTPKHLKQKAQSHPRDLIKRFNLVHKAGNSEYQDEN